jgi:hypothetical protein
MQNRRQTRKKRLLEAAGEVFRPSSPTSLGGHPSSDSVGSIPSSEMDVCDRLWRPARRL